MYRASIHSMDGSLPLNIDLNLCIDMNLNLIRLNICCIYLGFILFKLFLKYHSFSKELFSFQTEALIKSESLVAEASLKQQELTEALQVRL